MYGFVEYVNEELSFIDIDLFSMLKAWKLWNIFIFKLIILLGFTFLYGSFGSWFIVLQCFCVIFVTLVTQFLKHLIWKPYPFFTLWCPLQWEPSTKVRMYFSSFGSLPMLFVWRLQAKSKTTHRPTNKLKLQISDILLQNIAK